MTRAALAGAMLLSLLCGCISISYTAPPPPPPEPRTPPRFEAEAPPALESTGITGLQRATSLEACYYDEPSEQWLRFAYNRWFMAFTWDGAWFPLKQDEVLPELRSLHKPPPTPTPTPKTRRERLEELDRQLEEIDKREGAEPEP